MSQEVIHVYLAYTKLLGPLTTGSCSGPRYVDQSFVKESPLRMG